MTDTVSGYVDHIIFRNEENGYTVFVLADEGEEITCVGTFQYIGQGEVLEVQGHHTEHAVYGQQFHVESFRTKVPEDTAAMERYLGSGAIKGVGAALAARIVKHFGEDTIRVVEQEPERLSEVRGISERMAREIARQVEEKSDMRKAMIFLQKYGISLNLGAKIYQQYGQDLYQVLRENPYQMAEDIPGVGFKIADEIAGKIGIRGDSGYRIKSGLLYTLLSATGQGHVYLPQQELFRQAAALLQVEQELAEFNLFAVRTLYGKELHPLLPKRERAYMAFNSIVSKSSHMCEQCVDIVYVKGHMVYGSCSVSRMAIFIYFHHKVAK